MGRRVGVVALLGCLALASCGTDDGGLGPVETSVVVDDPEGIYRPGRAAHLEAVEWDEALASADGRRVTLRFLGSIKECWSLDRVTLRGDEERVVLTLFGGSAIPEGTACPDLGVVYEIVIALADPLRGRSIVDGAAPS